MSSRTTLTFIIAGLAVGYPWNALISSTDYYSSHLSPPLTLSSFESALTLVYVAFNLASFSLLTKHDSSSISEHACIALFFLVNSVTFTLLLSVPTAGATGFVVLTWTVAGLLGATSASYQHAMFAMAARADRTTSFVFGFALAGTLASAATLGARSFADAETTKRLNFGSALGVLGGGAVVVLWGMRVGRKVEVETGSRDGWMMGGSVVAPEMRGGEGQGVSRRDGDVVRGMDMMDGQRMMGKDGGEVAQGMTEGNGNDEETMPMAVGRRMVVERGADVPNSRIAVVEETGTVGSEEDEESTLMTRERMAVGLIGDVPNFQIAVTVCALAMWGTLLAFPSVVTAIKPVQGDLDPKEFTSILFLLFNVGDLTGRAVSKLLHSASDNSFLGFAVLRTVLLPIFFVCNRSAEPDQSDVWASDSFAQALVLSHGFFGGLLFASGAERAGRSTVDPGVAGKRVALATAVSLASGALCGSLVSLLL